MIRRPNKTSEILSLKLGGCPQRYAYVTSPCTCAVRNLIAVAIDHRDCAISLHEDVALIDITYDCARYMHDIKRSRAVARRINKEVPIFPRKLDNAISCTKKMMNLFASNRRHYETAGLISFVANDQERPRCAFLKFRC